MNVHLIARYNCIRFKDQRDDPIYIGLFLLHKIENRFYWKWIKGNGAGVLYRYIPNCFFTYRIFDYNQTEFTNDISYLFDETDLENVVVGKNYEHLWNSHSEK